MYLGDIRLGDTLDFHFTTRRFSTGAPHTLAGTPAVAAYPNNSTTEITAGITLTVDFDARTGLNHVRIVASSGNGYATATSYSVVITAGTVDSVSVVGEVVGQFSIEARSALMPTTAGRTLAIETDGMAHADVKEAAGTAWNSGAIGAATLASDTIAAAKIAAGAITAAKFAAGAIDAAAIATGAIDADALAADAITAAKIADGAIDAATFAAGAINAAAIASDAITAAKIATDAITAAKIADGAIDRAALAADTGLQSVRSNTAQAGAAGTITLDASASSTTDFYRGCPIYLTGGTGVGQVRICTAYNGTTKVATVDRNWATNPDNTTTFAVLPGEAPKLDDSLQVTAASVQGNVTGSVASVTGAVGSVTGNVGGNVVGTVGSLAAQAKADVNAEVVDALTVDTYAEPSAVPAATSTIKDKLNWLFALARNKMTQTSTTSTLRNDGDSGNVGTSTVSDDGTTATRGKWA